MSKKSYINYIAGRYFSSRKKVRMISTTSIITIIGTLLGTFAIIAALSVMNGFRDILFTRTQDMSPDLTFYVKNTSNEARSDLYDAIKEDTRIKMLTPSIERKMLVNSGKYQQLAFIKGIRPDEYKNILKLEPYLQEKKFLTDDLAKTSYPEIIMGLSLANKIGVGVRDTINLVSLLDVKTYNAPSMKCIVKDVFNVTVFDYDYRAYMHILDMQYLLNEPNYHQFEAELHSSKELNIVNKYWKEHIPENSRVASWWEEHLELFSAMQIEKVATFLVLSLIIIIAGFNLISSMIMLLLEKKWEIGILQSMGCAPRDVHRIYFRLGWYTGGLGMILGVVMAVILLLIQQYFPFFIMPGANDVYIFKYVPVIVNFWDVFATLIMVSILITISSLVPARRANKIKPLDAIKTKQ
ncbi:MAG: FtsX-like permease family protein [Candidatus Marinimicrobia bacterium]|nr:FtsX-like permease family protein [Candidatus Neomarinimicrobiota bacterium]